MVLENPASLPPIVRLTSVVELFSAEIWLLRTSPVLAPEQATKEKEDGEFAFDHR